MCAGSLWRPLLCIDRGWPATIDVVGTPTVGGAPPSVNGICARRTFPAGGVSRDGGKNPDLGVLPPFWQSPLHDLPLRRAGGEGVFGRNGCGPILAAIQILNVASQEALTDAPLLGASCHRSQRDSGTAAVDVMILVTTGAVAAASAIVVGAPAMTKSDSSFVGAVW